MFISCRALTIEETEKIMEATGMEGKQAILPRESCTQEYGNVKIPLSINHSNIISYNGDFIPPVIDVSS